MPRDLTSLSSRYDLAIIGAGITGAAAAYEAARRGLKVVLFEQHDFGSETSTGCFKTVHGGLRYLQSADLPRIFESVAEQRALRRLAPHAIRPLPFLVPCSGFGLRSRAALDFAAAIYEVFAWRRNSGVLAEAALPPHRLLSPSQVRELAPGLEQKVSGGVIFYDALMHSPERLVWSFVAGAKACGAQAHNYVRVTGFEYDGDGAAGGKGARSITRIKSVDCETGAEFLTPAACVINAAGPWINSIERLASVHPAAPVKFSKGIQAIVPRIFSSAAVAVESRFQGDGAMVARGNRSYFIIPWRSYSLIGTADALYSGAPADHTLLEAEVAGLVADIAGAVKSPHLTPQSVLHAFGGLRPIDARFSAKFDGLDYFHGTVEPSHDDRVIDHGASRSQAGLPQNLISVEAIKYSTARLIAERALKLAFRKLKRPYASLPDERLPGGQFNSIGGLTAEARKLLGDSVSDPAVVDHLVSQYGSLISEIAALVRRNPALGRPVGRSGTLAAEIVYCAQNESAVHISDLLLRRTSAATAGYPGPEETAAAAGLAAAELGWDRARVESETEQFRSRFPVESFSWKR